MPNIFFVGFYKIFIKEIIEILHKSPRKLRKSLCFIQQGQHYPDIKNCQRHHKKTELWTSIPLENRCKILKILSNQIQQYIKMIIYEQWGSSKESIDGLTFKSQCNLTY